MTSIRPFRPDDLPRLREICLLTGDVGDDATGRHVSDALLPDLFLEPYLACDPRWSWIVADDADVPVGYLVATPDSRAFAAWWRAEWTPAFARRHGAEASGPDAALLARGLDPESTIPEEVVDAYPAHLHIDLLDAARGGGTGRRLMGLLLARLADEGVPGVHLGMNPANTGARAFYDRLGFRAASADGDLLVRGITAADRS